MEKSAEDYLKEIKKDIHLSIDRFKNLTQQFKVNPADDIDKFFEDYLNRLFDNKTDQRIFQSINTLRFLEPKHVSECRAILDRFTLLSLFPKNGIAAEVGVDRGRFAERIYEITKPKKLHLVDKFMYEYQISEVKSRFKDDPNVIIHKSDSAEGARLFDDDYFDFIYIDTDHSYETTKKELNAYSNKIKSGGFISGHDYFQVGVSNGFSYGVMSAVHEFVVINDWKLYAVTLEPLENQSFMIQKP